MSVPNTDRRKHERFTIRVPIEFYAEGSKTLRCATADLSIGGCYLEMLFTFPIGTMLEVTLQVGRTVRAKAIVVSRDFRIGNGIQFRDMETADQDAVKEYVEAAIKARSPHKGD
jgi:c-di-GMP-binding flagellar brake protein YcgR